MVISFSLNFHLPFSKTTIYYLKYLWPINVFNCGLKLDNNRHKLKYSLSAFFWILTYFFAKIELVFWDFDIFYFAPLAYIYWEDEHRWSIKMITV